MNTMRVYLHDKLWEQDAAGFTKRIDQFLGIASKHGIKPLFVFFDSCWDADPKLGPQKAPTPGVHNSGWVQSPGRAGLADTANYPKLEAYMHGVLRAFGKDERILGWDLWNEPDNAFGGPGPDSPEGKEKIRLVTALLPQVFAWAREADPSQPLTSGVWIRDDWATKEKLTSVERTQLGNSDIVTFHVYDWPEVARTQDQTTADLWPADHLHRISRAQCGLDLRFLAAHRPQIQRRHDQLGPRGGKDSDYLPVGLVAEAVYAGRAGGVVPRCVPSGWQAVSAD